MTQQQKLEQLVQKLNKQARAAEKKVTALERKADRAYRIAMHKYDVLDAATEKQDDITRRIQIQAERAEDALRDLKWERAGTSAKGKGRKGRGGRGKRYGAGGR